MTHYHEHYDHYDPNMIKRLDHFYGDVENNIHQNIAKNIIGSKILDIGCGYGSLINFLQQNGFEATGIDQHEPSVAAGKMRFPQANLKVLKTLTDIPGKSFDTVILKDVIHHVYEEDDINEFLSQIRKICKHRLIIVDPNPTFILKLCRRIIGHVDPVCPPKEAKRCLENLGYKVKNTFYTEFFSFPLSGGFVGPELVSNKCLRQICLKLDTAFNFLFRLIKLDRLLCWRYYLIVDTNR